MKAINLVIAATIILGTVSCKRKYDEPPVKEIPVGNILTISDIKQMYFDNNGAYTFTEDYSIYATATTDETSGNFYKEVYVQDDSSAIQLRLDFSGGIYIGDSIRIALKGATIDMYRGMFQLSGINADDNVVKQATEKYITPEVVTIAEVSSNLEKYVGRLVQFDNVEFSEDDVCLGATWADAVNQSDVNLTIMDCGASPLVVRTSGYSDFAATPIPSGNGSLIAIVGIYTSDTNPANWTWQDAQLYVRNDEENPMAGTRCAGPLTCPVYYLRKDFEDGSLVSGGWTTYVKVGALNWTIGTVGGSYANMSNYNGSTKEDNESWLISPAVDLSSATSPAFSFRNAYNYTGPAIEALVSTNYAGSGDPNLASWTPIPATLSSGGWAWVSSGIQNFSGYAGGTIYVAFKYTGTTAAGSTWEIDDVVIEEL